MTSPSTPSPAPGPDKASVRTAIGWGVVVGVVQAASPLAFWWLDPATVYALGLAAIAAIYIGFAVADGRARIIVVECGVAMAFVVVAAAGITGSAWLLAFGLAAHGVKDAWQPVRLRHPVVATVLRGRRLGRCRDHRRRDRRGDPLPSVALKMMLVAWIHRLIERRPAVGLAIRPAMLRAIVLPGSCADKVSVRAVGGGSDEGDRPGPLRRGGRLAP